MARKTRILVRVLAAALALSFAWLKLRGVPFPRLTSETTATILFRSALILYYFGWLAGVLMDTRDEEDLLVAAPNRGRLPLVGLILAITISVVFGLLCWVDTYRKLALALALLWILDKTGWVYLYKTLLGPEITRARSIYKNEGDLFLAEQVNQLEEFFTAPWHWWRFGCGLGLVLVINVLTWTELGSYVALITTYVTKASLISLSLLLFVVIFEGWIWVYRLRRFHAIRFLDGLGLRYNASKK